MSEKTSRIIFSIIVIALCVFAWAGTRAYYSSKLGQTRAQLDAAQAELDISANINSELKQQLAATRKSLERERKLVEQSRDAIEKLGNTTGQNIEDIDGCIRLVREIRTQIQDMENNLFN